MNIYWFIHLTNKHASALKLLKELYNVLCILKMCKCIPSLLQLNPTFQNMVGRIIAPKVIYILIPRAYEYIMLHDKGRLKLQVELSLLFSRTWDEEIILVYLGRPNKIWRSILMCDKPLNYPQQLSTEL